MRSSSRSRLLLLLFFAALAGLARAENGAQNIDLHGTIHSDQDDSYVLAPFSVPRNITRVDVAFDYTGREEHTTLDLGLFDTERFRGWSGGNKHAFSIGVADATPSYLPGPLLVGEWKLVIGVAHIEPGHTSNYTVHIHFAHKGDVDGFAEHPLATGERWYRGDLHMHTAHSDGSCTSQSGKQAPCPLFVTVEDAAKQQLDFISITDHNTTSHYDAERELQPYFDRLLLIPGRELTTYAGHANVYGTTEFLDFRAEAKESPSINRVFAAARDAGAIVTVNHPGDPTGATCIGCGWSVKDTDWSLVTGIEAINGNDPPHYNADIAFWDRLLGEGHRLIAIGGSDTHRPERGTIGHPTTIVDAPELSVPAVLAAIRAGRVSVDLTASHDRVLDLEATSSSTHARMGDDMTVTSGQRTALAAHITASPGATLVWLLDGHAIAALPNQPVPASAADLSAAWTSDGRRHWLRAEVREPHGTLMLLSNPIFFNWTGTP